MTVSFMSSNCPVSGDFRHSPRTLPRHGNRLWWFYGTQPVFHVTHQCQQHVLNNGIAQKAQIQFLFEMLFLAHFLFGPTTRIAITLFCNFLNP